MDKRRLQEKIYCLLRLRKFRRRANVNGRTLIRVLRVSPMLTAGERLHDLCDSSLIGMGPIWERKATRHNVYYRARYEGFGYGRVKYLGGPSPLRIKTKRTRPPRRRVLISDRVITRGTINRTRMKK